MSDRKSTRLNSSHSLHDALPIWDGNAFASLRLCVKTGCRMKKPTPVSRSGRFTGGPAADVAQFTESVSFDWRLWRHDILGSMAHAEMLHKIGVLKKNELHAIIRGLNKIALEIRADK